MGHLFHNPWSPICAAQILLGVGYPLECGWSTGGHTSKENKLSQLLSTASPSQLWVAICAHLPSPCLSWIYADLCMLLQLLLHLLWVHKCSCPTVSRKHCFIIVIYSSRSYNPPVLSSVMIPDPREEGPWYRCPTHARALHSLCTLTSCGSLCYSPSTADSSFSAGRSVVH